MKSIRQYMGRRIIVGTILLGFLCGGACYWTIRRALLRNEDSLLRQKARALASLIEPEVFGYGFEWSPKLMPEYSRDHLPEYFRIRLLPGKQGWQSASWANWQVDDRDALNRDGAQWANLPGKRRGRAIALNLPIPPAEETSHDEALVAAARQLSLGKPERIEVVCARGSEDLDSALLRLGIIMSVGGGAFLVGLILLTRKVVNKGLKPVHDLGQKVRTADLEEAGLPDLNSDVPEELHPFRDSFGGFVERVQAAMQREQRIAGNIAHELRTPVAELRAVTEMARKWPEDGELQRKSIADSFDVALQMDRLLRTCLRMAHLESGTESIKTERFDAIAIIQGICRQTLGFANHRQVELQLDLGEELWLNSDPAILELALANVLDNAFHHAPAGTWVRIEAANAGTLASIKVLNPSEELVESDLRLLEEPFWRKSESSCESRHVGLGMAMVRAAVSSLNGELHLGLEREQSEFSVTLLLPASSVDSTDSAPQPTPSELPSQG